MRIFDCHAHLACEPLISQIDDVIERMHRSSVDACMVICDPGDKEPDHERAAELVSSCTGLYLSAACHPQNAYNYSREVEDTVIRLASLKQCRCIGETGLDNYDNRSTPEEQKNALERQMDIAYELGLPIQLHVRNAHNEMTDILRARKRKGCLPRGFVHCFTRSPELADVYLRLGYSISIAGPITFTNANKLKKAVQSIPIERLLIETDSPWVSPQSHKGKPCEPSFIIETLQCISQIKEIPAEDLSLRLWENAIEMFQIEE